MRRAGILATLALLALLGSMALGAVGYGVDAGVPSGVAITAYATSLLLAFVIAPALLVWAIVDFWQRRRRGQR